MAKGPFFIAQIGVKMSGFGQTAVVSLLTLFIPWAQADQREVAKSYAVGKHICDSSLRHSKSEIACHDRLEEAFKSGMPPAVVLSEELCSLEAKVQVRERCRLQAAHKMAAQDLSSPEFRAQVSRCEKGRQSARSACLDRAFAQEKLSAQGKSCERELNFMHDGLLKYNPLDKQDASSEDLKKIWEEHIFCDFSAASCDPKKLTPSDRSQVRACLPVFRKMKSGKAVQLGVEYISKALDSDGAGSASGSQTAPPAVR